MSAMVAAAWTPTESGHPSPIAARLPDELEILFSHLTPHGEEALRREIAEALGQPDSLAAVARVLSSWWYTLIARHEPGYSEAMKRPSPSPADAVYQSADELKAELGR
jgi:hypothetical protein